MFWISAAALVLAIAVNCVAVHAQKRHRFYDRFGRWDWTAHIVLLCLVWGLAIALMAVTVVVGPSPSWPLPGWVRPIGIVVGVTASVIFGLGIRELGAQALFNGIFFGRGPRYVEGGIYGLIDDPMYIAYTLSFVALALREADAVYFLLAVVSLVGLNGIEARVERVDPPLDPPLPDVPGAREAPAPER